MHPERSYPQANAGAFSLYCPATVFEDANKSDAGKSQRIAGIISTDDIDSEGEQVLQDGLDYSYLLSPRGFLNNDHSSSHHDLLGIPESVQRYNKGEILPNGTTASANLTWCEGYLLDTEKGRKTYEMARSLQGTGRNLGFSIEGTIDRRQGPGGKVIGKARIRHVAITHQPVNQGTTLEALVRSLKPLRKEMTITPPSGNATTLVRQNLSHRITDLASSRRKKRRGKGRAASKSQKNSHTLSGLLKSIFKAMPHASVDYALWLAHTIDNTPGKAN